MAVPKAKIAALRCKQGWPGLLKFCFKHMLQDCLQEAPPPASAHETLSEHDVQEVLKMPVDLVAKAVKSGQEDLALSVFSACDKQKGVQYASRGLVMRPMLHSCQDPDQVILQTWDFAGQEMFYSMAHVFITSPGRDPFGRHGQASIGISFCQEFMSWWSILPPGWMLWLLRSPCVPAACLWNSQ